MTTVLSLSSRIKSIRTGDGSASDLIVDDVVLTYDVVKPMPGFRKVLSIKPVQIETLTVELMGTNRGLMMATDTIVLDQHAAPVRFGDYPDAFYGFCTINQRRAAIKKVVAYYQGEPTTGLEITWIGEDYLWSGGVLCGSSTEL